MVRMNSSVAIVWLGVWVVLAVACGGGADEGQDTPTSTATPTATPTTEPIDVRSIHQSIEDRYSTPSGDFSFGDWYKADVTGDQSPEIIVTWSGGGSCGYYAEIWGYYQGQLLDLSPRDGDGFPNDLPCGGFGFEDFLMIGLDQLVATERTYGGGPESHIKKVYCWDGAFLVQVVEVYVDIDGNPIREQTIREPALCREGDG